MASPKAGGTARLRARNTIASVEGKAWFAHGSHLHRLRAQHSPGRARGHSGSPREQSPLEVFMSDSVRAIVVDANAPGRLSVQSVKACAGGSHRCDRPRDRHLAQPRRDQARPHPVRAGRPAGLGFRRRGGGGREAGRWPAGRRARRRLSLERRLGRTHSRAGAKSCGAARWRERRASGDLARGRTHRTACAAAGRAVARPKGPR